MLAKADGETPGIRAEVTELKRGSGDILMLKFSLFNDSDKPMMFLDEYASKEFSGVDYNSIGGVHLIDNVGKKKYLVIRDASNNCVCSRQLNTIALKSSANLWAKFPAPPANVGKISVVIPHFTPIDDIPISQ